MRPLIAANYSFELLGLLAREPEIVSGVKATEFGPERYHEDYRQLRRLGKTLLLHGLGQAVNPGVPEYWTRFSPETLCKALAITETPYLSVHLEWRTPEPCDRGPDEFLASLVPQIADLGGLTGLSVHLENVFSYRDGSGPYRNPPFIGDPGFIAEALDRTGGLFLLDLGHARLAAWHRGENAERYVRSLPLEHVVEIHISGPAMVNGEMRDRHEAPTDADYRLLEIALERAKPQVLTLEYGGVGPLFADRTDGTALAEQLDRLSEVASSLK